jgi:hypothetical protein
MAEVGQARHHPRPEKPGPADDEDTHSDRA